MTTLRRQRWHFPLIVLCLGLWWGANLRQSGTAVAATTEQIVTDRNTGLAIYGFDPVAYFTDGEAKTGRDDLEMSHNGVAWRFRNEGNRAAFADDPDVYMPQFGGHDPIGIAEGVARPGHPEIFAVYNQQLFLFYSAEARRAFAADPDSAALQAEANWPHVSHTLTP